jgi:hypothetical protein
MRDTTPKPFVFVLMPFDESFDDVYKLGIKPACQAAGAYCERVDEQIFQESILERIYNQIAKADLIVSDMTNRSPNVFYETGYAHALGKKVILLTQQSDDIPFDLQHYPHIVYRGKITFLKDELEHHVSWYITQPDTSVLEPRSQLKFFVAGQEVSDGVEVSVPWAFVRPPRDFETNSMRRIAIFELSVHNPSNRVIDARDVLVALVLPPRLVMTDPENDLVVYLPDGRQLTKRLRLRQMFPLDWESVILGQFYRVAPQLDLLVGKKRGSW